MRNPGRMSSRSRLISGKSREHLQLLVDAEQEAVGRAASSPAM
jgi:hypothetical protein